MDLTTARNVTLGAAVGASAVMIGYQVLGHMRWRRSRRGLMVDVSQEELDSMARAQLLSNGSLSQFNTNHHHSLVATPARSLPSSSPDAPPPLETEESPEAQPILNLLYNIAEDQARRDGYIHRGVTCNNCGQSPLCGVRYKCANCIDLDICERCEPKDIHNRTHLFIKIKIPIPPLANHRTVLFKPMYPGSYKIKSHITLDDVTRYMKETFFEQTEIEAMYEQYQALCTSERGITREVFDQSLGPLAQKKNLITDRLFKFYDRNNDHYIDFEEMLHGLTILVKGTQVEKMPYAFAGYDLEDKKSISKENLRRMFKAYFLITIDLVRDVVKSCEEEMMANFDDDTGKPVSSLFSAPIPPESTMGTKTSGKAPLPKNPGGRESMWPVMEAMSQDAIDEMADKFFKMVNLGDNERMTYEQFSELAQVDNSLINWFDALGTVF